MNILSLLLYVFVNACMVVHGLSSKERIYQFPFWAGILALGWFVPQAVAGLLNNASFPAGSYSAALFFATLCTIFLWLGFLWFYRREPAEGGWLETSFDRRRLYWAGAALCVFGFFFQWKLWSLPEEMLAQMQWSGATVKYYFLASVFKFGFLTLWLLYLSEGKIVAPRLLVLLIPCLLLLLSEVVLRGRRAEMMELASYILVSAWLVRRSTVPRWFIVGGLVVGLLLVNAIGAYRTIMKDKDQSVQMRLSSAAEIDYLERYKQGFSDVGSEFKNYIYFRQAMADTREFNYGLRHWNELVFNYVPGQLFGQAFKESLMIERVDIRSPKNLAAERYGHSHRTGTTSTGYSDSFGSFGWAGWIKFLAIGGIMGTLYRHAMRGGFFAQLLYVYCLTAAMHAVSHGTHRILFSVWVYFILMACPALLFARERRAD